MLGPDAADALAPAALAPDAADALAPSAEPRLTGARNESSALFTLSHLAKLSGPTQALPAGKAAAAPAASGEGSGLIDIRALARTYDPARGRDARPSGGNGLAGGDDLPVFPTPAFVEPGVLLPIQPRRTDRRLIIGLIAALGMLAICATLLVVVTVTRAPEASAATAAPAAIPAPDLIAPLSGPRTPTSGATTSALASAEPARTSDARTSDTRTSDTRTSDARPSDARTSDTRTSDVRPSGTRPSDARPSDTRTADAWPSGTRPSDARPSGTQPSETRTPASELRTRPASTASIAQPLARGAVGGPAPTPARRGAPSPAAEPARASTRTAVPAGSCDQVTCLVNGDSECCRRLLGAAPGPPTALDPAAVTARPAGPPEHLDRAAIDAGIATIAVRPCDSVSTKRGFVRAQLKVSPAGTVAGVTIQDSPDPALSTCVAAQAQRGRFRATQRGSTVTYAWRF